MSKPSSQLYRVQLPDLKSRISDAIERGCGNSKEKPIMFFRADDIGIPSRSFSEMIECFKKNHLPLCLATVPSWLNHQRLSDIQSVVGTSKEQWYWHQHGVVHRNFESSGKKQEFGETRSEETILLSLQRGKERLYKLLGSNNGPVFTPPWNRCSSATLRSLHALGFKAISRSSGAKPESPSELPDIQVNVDLHTRKETSGKDGFFNLLEELETGLASGRCGVMLHHQRMNCRAVDFLDIFLQCCKKQSALSCVHFGDIIGD